jgi:hypothetical protein
MMTLNSIEAQTGVIDMSDSSYGAIESFIEFLYLGTAEKLDEFVEELFVLADKYCVEQLKVGDMLKYHIYNHLLGNLSGTHD